MTTNERTDGTVGGGVKEAASGPRLSTSEIGRIIDAVRVRAETAIAGVTASERGKAVVEAAAHELEERLEEVAASVRRGEISSALAHERAQAVAREVRERTTRKLRDLERDEELEASEAEERSRRRRELEEGFEPVRSAFGALGIVASIRPGGKTMRERGLEAAAAVYGESALSEPERAELARIRAADTTRDVNAERNGETGACAAYFAAATARAVDEDPAPPIIVSPSFGRVTPGTRTRYIPVAGGGYALFPYDAPYRFVSGDSPVVGGNVAARVAELRRAADALEHAAEELEEVRS